MSVEISPFVRRVWYEAGEYTVQEVADYLAGNGDDKFIGLGMPTLREESESQFRLLVERYGLSMDQKMHRDTSAAGMELSRLVMTHSFSKFELIRWRDIDTPILI